MLFKEFHVRFGTESDFGNVTKIADIGADLMKIIIWNYSKSKSHNN